MIEIMNSIRLAFPMVVATLATGMFPSILPAQANQPQTSTPSLAEIARQSRAEHRNTTRAGIVWTNYNLPSGSAGVSVVGQRIATSGLPRAKTADDGAPGNSGKVSAPVPEQKDSSNGIAAKLAHAKERLASLRVDLDLAQRKLALDQHQFDSNPNSVNDKNGQSQLRLESQQS
jgi:hypothetical protein